MQKKRKIRQRTWFTKKKLVKKDKDKSEECSEIDDKESDDKTVDLFDKGIKNKRVKSDQELTDLRNLSVKW